MVVVMRAPFKGCFEMFGSRYTRRWKVEHKKIFARKSFLPDNMGLLGHLRLFPATTTTATVIKKDGTKISSHRGQPSCFYRAYRTEV